MDRALQDCIASVCTNSAESANHNLPIVDGNDATSDSTLTNGGIADMQLSGCGVSGSSEAAVQVEFLHDFVASSLPKSRHQVLAGAGSSLVLSMHHHNPSMRKAAIDQLGKTLAAKEKVCVLGS